MHLSEILTTELAAFAKKHKVKSLDIVETGTIRGDGENYQRNDGWSTVTFAEYVKKNGGSLISIDLDVTVAEKVLKAKKLQGHVSLQQGHSIEVLADLVYRNSPADPDDAEHYGSVDVAFLDSDNDGALIFHEYLVVKKLMRSPGLILVDDVDIESTGVVKGHQILPWAIAHEIPHRIVTRTGDDYQTGVLIFEV